jgi:hypothetical protein
MKFILLILAYTLSFIMIFLDLGVEVKIWIASHIITLLHMNYEERDILLYAGCSNY